MRNVLSHIIVPMLLLGLLLSEISCAETSGVTSTPTPTAITSPINSDYPLTVTDLLGRSVEVDQKPVSIVTTHPTATEMLYSVGGMAVGRDSSSKYPPQVQELPTVGSAYNLNVEAIASLKPDLIIIEGLTQSRYIGSLENLGVPVLAVRAASLDDIVDALKLVGEAIDANEEAAQVVDDIEARIETAQSQYSGNMSVLILISDAERNIYAAKPESYPGTVAALLGLSNPAAALPESGPYPGFALFTSEQALTSNPDMVLAISPAPAPAPRLSQVLPQVPGFNQMAAVKEGQVAELDPFLFLQAQGPRIADAVEELLRIINEATA